ncbi:MAG: hypothetical protein A2010_02775 [Nitrospirae bacterium GWD2_57_9]|nr:MAG: hypothetical protein A2010_02775 [Nitrospirae bacterium GWD2_57_9]
MPAWMSFAMIAAELEAGPIVARIFVRLFIMGQLYPIDDKKIREKWFSNGNAELKGCFQLFPSSRV